MTHTRYWAASLAAALCGAFIVVVRFAFDRSATPWIVFGVAIGATVFSIAALSAALRRDNGDYSGLSAASAVIGAWTIIAMLTLNKDAAGWVAFADGLALLALSVRGLALHETSVEHIVYALDKDMRADQPAGHLPASSPAAARTRHLTASTPMRSWASWLASMSTAIAGGFIVVMTFAMTRPGANHVSPRWIAFGIAIAVAAVAIGSVIDHGLLPRVRKTADWAADGRIGLLVLALMSLATAAALIVTMAVYSGSTARWLAFALGCGMAGVSVLTLAVHEVTTERVRHELEIAEPSAASAPMAATAPRAA